MMTSVVPSAKNCAVSKIAALLIGSLPMKFAMARMMQIKIKKHAHNTINATSC